jgi:hypothetical protein
MTGEDKVEVVTAPMAQLRYGGLFLAILLWPEAYAPSRIPAQSLQKRENRMNYKLKIRMLFALCAIVGLTVAALSVNQLDDPLSAQESKVKNSPAKVVSQDKAAEKSLLQRFMKAKLGLSEGLLDGLVMEDFEKLSRNSKALVVLSLASEWNVSDDSAYVQQSDEFRRAARQLNKAADEHNLDGASLAFVQLTMSCVECHRLVRKGLKAAEKSK